MAAPREVGKAADHFWPAPSLIGAVKGSPARVEFNGKSLFYSTPYDNALRENRRLRYLCLAGTDIDMMVRCIGQVDYPTLNEFVEKMATMTRETRYVQVTTPAGGDVQFRMPKTEGGKPDPTRPNIARLGYANTPGSHMVEGRMGGAPDFVSINGRIVFDGSVLPPCEVLEEPVVLTVTEGTILKVEGGRQAREFES